MNVAVVGASDDPEKYSYKALQLLLENGHRVFPVHPKLRNIGNLKVYPAISSVPEKIHTISLYVSKEISSRIEAELIAAAPARIIFNPGAENPELEARVRTSGIQALEACTLVLLKTRQFGV